MALVFCYIAFYLIIFITGACIGSFLNVCIYRIPKGESIIKGRSHCTSCNENIKFRDMIPIISWCALKGKCRNCGERISFRYTLVELLTGALFVLAFLKYGFLQKPFLPALVCLFFACLIIVFFMDWDTQLINTGVLIIIALIAAARYFIVKDLTIKSHLLGAVVISIPFLIIVLASRERAMGRGDAFLMFSAGLFLGLKSVLVAVFIGLVLGSAAGLIQKHKSQSSRFAFGPWLSAGAAAAALYGNELADLYLKFVGIA